MKVWKEITDYYEKNYNIPPRILDMIAVDPILKLCVEGLSNLHIVERLDFDMKYIMEEINKNLIFSGWDNDLDFNPIFIFKSHQEYEDYVKQVNTISNITPIDIINKSYNLCRKYKKIIREIDEYYN
jgi:hypothetical protein